MANIREHLAANNAEVERQENERISNTRQIARVEQQLQYEEKTTKADLGKMQASLQRLKDRLAELQESEERHKAAAAAVEEEVAVQVCALLHMFALKAPWALETPHICQCLSMKDVQAKLSQVVMGFLPRHGAQVISN